jgi:hypothetical protein
VVSEEYINCGKQWLSADPGDTATTTQLPQFVKTDGGDSWTTGDNFHHCQRCPSDTAVVCCCKCDYSQTVSDRTLKNEKLFESNTTSADFVVSNAQVSTTSVFRYIGIKSCLLSLYAAR